jgi:uncharacterized membrane protein
MWYKTILNKIFNGLILFLFPIMLIIFVIEKAIEITTVVITPFKHLFPAQKVFGVGIISLFIFLLILILCYLIGAIASNKKVEPILDTLDEVLSTMIPTYHIIKTKANDAAINPDENWKSILVTDGNDWTIAFEIEQQIENYSIVYFPTPPDGKSGKIKIVEKSKIKYLEVSVKNVLKSFKKYGKGLQIN